MTVYSSPLIDKYTAQIDELLGRLAELTAENRRLRQANAILALPRVTEAQLVETERALRRLRGVEDL